DFRVAIRGCLLEERLRGLAGLGPGHGLALLTAHERKRLRGPVEAAFPAGVAVARAGGTAPRDLLRREAGDEHEIERLAAVGISEQLLRCIVDDEDVVHRLGFLLTA